MKESTEEIFKDMVMDLCDHEFEYKIEEEKPPSIKTALLMCDYLMESTTKRRRQMVAETMAVRFTCFVYILHLYHANRLIFK